MQKHPTDVFFKVTLVLMLVSASATVGFAKTVAMLVNIQRGC